MSLPAYKQTRSPLYSLSVKLLSYHMPELEGPLAANYSNATHVTELETETQAEGISHIPCIADRARSWTLMLVLNPLIFCFLFFFLIAYHGKRTQGGQPCKRAISCGLTFRGDWRFGPLMGSPPTFCSVLGAQWQDGEKTVLHKSWVRVALLNADWSPHSLPRCCDSVLLLSLGLSYR